MSKVVIMDHPLIHHKLSIIRDKNTGTKLFRQTVSELAMLMGYEISRSFKTVEKDVETPVAMAKCYQLEKEVVLVPILRAGLGMVDGMLALMPTAKVGHIGLYRDEETLMPCEYYAKFPKEISSSEVLLLDPMLATGGSVLYAVNLLKKRGVKNISYVGLVGTKTAIDLIQENHPDVNIFLAACDNCLNENGYIVPGLGDCGDRLFGTK